VIIISGLPLYSLIVPVNADIFIVINGKAICKISLQVALTPEVKDARIMNRKKNLATA